jgi:hypothetical protein
MKTLSKLVSISFFIAVLIVSCKQASATSDEASTEATVATALQKSEQNPVIIKDSIALKNRKFIRTAGLKFKVKNVSKSTALIENTVTKCGGFVASSNLQSTILETKETQISTDSTLVTSKYTVESNIILRVPNSKFDTIVKTIAQQIDFLDFRVLKADDVALQLLSNQLAQNRSTKKEKRMEKAIDSKGKKLATIMDAEEQLGAQQEQNDSTKIENLSLQDQVNFSTITLQIYQRQCIKQEVVANDKSNDVYPPIGLQLLDGLKTGWMILETLLAFVVRLWSIIALLFIGFLLYKKYFK